MIRKPAVAGHFYPGNPDRLRQDVEGFLKAEAIGEPRKAIGVVSPHAGYVYSGHVAGAALGKVSIPNKVIVLCPNHTGSGAWAAINEEGSWRTPLGDIPIDTPLAQRLMQLDSSLEEDSMAHAREHALEVQLPFLQTLQPDLQIVPLCLSHFSYPECEHLGKALAGLIEENAEPVLMVASSDLNHYESQERTLVKDQMAIDCILERDPEKLYQTVHEENISMCGVIPTTSMLIAANCLGANKAELIKHATSGDISGDYTGVVGYAGMIIT